MSNVLVLMVYVPFDGTADEHEGPLVIRQDNISFVPPPNMRIQNELDGPCLELDPEKPFTYLRVSDGYGRGYFDFLRVHAKTPSASRSEIIDSFSKGVIIWHVYKSPPESE